MNTIKTSEVLDLAADAIQMSGWTQGSGAWDNLEGSGLCLEGGIAAAVGDSVLYTDGAVHAYKLKQCPAYKAVQEYLGHQTLWMWNDTRGRTGEEVVEVLRASAAVERVKESYETEDQPLPVEFPSEVAA